MFIYRMIMIHCIYNILHDLIIFPFIFFLESCKLNNGYQWNLIQQFEFRVTQYGNPNPKHHLQERSDKVMRYRQEPFRCKKVFGLQHHLCLAPAEETTQVLEKKCLHGWLRVCLLG